MVEVFEVVLKVLLELVVKSVSSGDEINDASWVGGGGDAVGGGCAGGRGLVIEGRW